MRLIILPILTAAIATACTNAPKQSNMPFVNFDCALAVQETAVLEQWRESGFSDQQTDQAARDFASCLSHPNPFLRDKIGYEGLTAVLRSGEVSETTRRDLIEQLSANLTDTDAAGFQAPFSALGLSELIRTDRVEPFLTPEERVDISAKAADYLANVSDYRAFDDQEGWRHGVAHGADVAMQLALNPNVDIASLELLRAAITQQITARSGHAFTHNEPERLARPILFMAMQDKIGAEDWAAWFGKLADPAPLSNWGVAFQSEKELARLHNLKSFARVLYINASLSENDAMQPISEGALELLRALP